MGIDNEVEHNFLVLDFEFTVNNQRVGRPRFFFQEIIEVGAVQLTNSCKMEKEYQTFVKPQFYPRLTTDCKNITLIRQEDVDNGLPLKTVLNELNSLYTPDKTMLVAWGDADRGVLNNVCQKYVIPYPFIWDDYIDLATEYKSYKQHAKHVSLKKAIEELGIKPVGIPHSALDDTLNTTQILINMLQQGWKPGVNNLGDTGTLPDAENNTHAISTLKIGFN